MTISMAGVDCRELFTLMTFFGQGTDFANDSFRFLDGAPSIRPPLDLTDTDDTDNEEEKPDPSTPASTAPTSAASASTAFASTADPPGPVDILEPKEPRVKSKPKAQYADKAPSLAQTQGFFPHDKESLHNTGIPLNYHVKRAGSSQTGRSIYICPYESECSMPPYTGDIASTGSHVRRHHLGHSLVCPYCGLRFYNASGWKDHMTSKHSGMPLYGSEVGSMVHPVPVPVGATGESVPVTGAAPLSVSIPEPDPVDTLPYVPDVVEDEGDEAQAPTKSETTTAPPSAPEPTQADSPAQGIDSYSIKDIRHLMQFLPSDLRQYSYYGGGSWMGRIPKDDSKTVLSAAELVSQAADLEVLEPAQDEDEEPLVRKKCKHNMHLFPQEHYGKIWRPDDDEGDTSTV